MRAYLMAAIPLFVTGMPGKKAEKQESWYDVLTATLTT
jgi:hypothetical protein